MKYCGLTILVAMALLVSGGCSKPRPGVVTNGIMFYQPVPVKFETGKWTFFVGTEDEVGYPIIVYLKFYVHDGKSVQRIAKPEDMNKINGLSIKTQDEAISYLRLFTRDSMFVMFDEPYAIEQSPDSASVVSDEDGFVVTRRLTLTALDNPHGYPVFEFREKVTSDGKYTCLSKKLVEHVPYEKYPFPIIL